MKILLSALLISVLGLANLAGQTITLSFFNRPPYYYLSEDRPRGFLLERAEKVLSAAGIPYKVHELPTGRIQTIMGTKKERHISIGWFKNAEREAMSRFSLPLYRNLPQVVLVRASRAAEFRALGSFAGLVETTELSLGTVEGFSYGPYLDFHLQRMGNRVERAVVSPAQNIAKLAAGRFDCLVLDQEEAAELIAQAGFGKSEFALISYPDIPAGNYRYLWCSMAITQAEMDRINTAIMALYPEVD